MQEMTRRDFLKGAAMAGACNGCGQCLAKCPQGLNVPEQLKKVAETFGF